MIQRHLGEHGIAQVTICAIVKNLGGIKIRVSQWETGDFVIPKTIFPRAKGNNTTIARRSEAERRVVHTKLAYEHFVAWCARCAEIRWWLHYKVPIKNGSMGDGGKRGIS